MARIGSRVLLAALAAWGGLAGIGAGTARADAVVLYGASKLENGGWLVVGGTAGTAFGPSVLYRIDPATGVATAVAPIREASGAPFRNVSGLAFLGTRLLGAANDDDLSATHLIEIDPTTGLASEIGVIGTDDAGSCPRTTDLAWDAVTSTLWGIGDACNGVGAQLLAVNPTTGGGTPVGELTLDSVGGALAARPGTGVLVESPGDGTLGELNKITGAYTAIPMTSGFQCCYNAADVDPATGLVYFTLRDAQGSFGQNESFLVTADLGAAAVQPQAVGILRDGTDIPIQGFDGLAFYTVNADACFPGPLDGCFESTSSNKSSLKMKPKPGNPQKNKLSWSWKKGEATTPDDFGNPLGVTSYRLCVYDESAGVPSLVVDAAIPAGLEWKAGKNGFQYKDKGNADGVQKVGLKAGSDGKSSVKVSGKGVALPALPLTQGPTVTAQLVNDEGACWSTSFTMPASKNDAKQFKDRGD